MRLGYKIHEQWGEAGWVGRGVWNEGHASSVHEGEALLVFLGDVSGELDLETQLGLLVVVLGEGGLDEDAAGHDSSDGAAQVADFEEVGSAVEVVEFLGVEFADEGIELLADDVLDDVGGNFGRLLDVVLELVDDMEDELEGLLVDVRDLDLNKT